VRHLTLALLALSLEVAATPQWIVTKREARAVWDIPSSLPTKFLDADQTFLLVTSPVRPFFGEGFAVQPNFTYAALGTDPDFEKSWGLKNTGQILPEFGAGQAGSDIGAEVAWAAAPSTSDVVVAILDSGLDLGHPDLKPQLWTGPLGETGWNSLKPGTPPQDDNGHGTFCAGIVGASPNNGLGTRGVAPHAKLMAVKILDKDGMGTSADAIAGIDYAVRNGAKVLNASWGGSEFDPALYDAVRKAGDRGTLFIAAAGNNAKNNDSDSRPIYPASFRLPNMITVAAYDPRDSLATFSNFGKDTSQLGAPGVAIYSTTTNGYRYGEGTSFAAPFVSGVAALVWGFAPKLDSAALRDRLLWTSEPLHYYERERTLTGGRVHAGNAVRDFRPPRPKPPTAWTSFSSNAGTLHPYENKTLETFRFTQSGAKHVRAHFKGFETESCCDRVILKDGQGNFISEYKGKLGDFWSADALGDTLVVEFISDFSMAAYGFDVDSYEIAD